MKSFLAAASLLLICGASQAQANLSYYLLVEEKNMSLVRAEDFSVDATSVCVKSPHSTNFPDDEKCIGYAPAWTLHKILSDEDGAKKYKNLKMTREVLVRKTVGKEKISQLLRFNFITESGYIGFSQGSAYSWNTDSKYFNATVDAAMLLAIAPTELAGLELINSLPEDPLVGKTWKENDEIFKVEAVFKNGLVEVSEGLCYGSPKETCEYSSLRSLVKMSRIKQ